MTQQFLLYNRNLDAFDVLFIKSSNITTLKHRALFYGAINSWDLNLQI